MLSIIISSYQSHYYKALEKNIADTCGIPYEIIKIENPGIMGICEAYNLGAQKSKYDNLLFLHEDVKFVTNNWGNKLLEGNLSLDNVGVIGLAGNIRKFRMCYGFRSMLDHESFIYVKHDDSAVHSDCAALHNKDIKHQVRPVKIKVIDGVFLAMHKAIWQRFRFDEKLTGFHFYDIDISLRSSEHYQNYLIPDIEMIHYSNGNFGDDWVRECIKFNKRKFYSFDKPTGKERNIVRKQWYLNLRGYKINFVTRLKYVLSMGVDRYSRKAMIQFILKK